MRTATCALVAYAILLVLGSLWMTLGRLPWIFGGLVEWKPEVAAIAAAYLGLTARRSVAGAVGASIVVGYLSDLIGGAPVGLYALISGVVCILGHLVHRRILVRGWGVTVGFSFFVGLATAVMAVMLRALFAQPLGGVGTELARMLTSGLATAAIGPLVLRLLRRIDAAFARTHRERDAALEGLAP
ncbi:MAG: hypothetical protein H6709_21970 [Kofleriaceae bacterium]|nr:hypothetical protein [Myxococcales bacterium]MCB9563481.1 hypothetical protein [Kofleriaceae bacterium]MCB9574753.1 hypothetical protein [Kofleriaceae bacterium]